MKKNFIFLALLFGFFSGFSQNIVYLDDKTFKEKIWNYDKNPEWKYEGTTAVLIEFYAEWCKPCKLMAPHLEELQTEYGSRLQIYKINIDSYVKPPQMLNINSIPTVLYIEKSGIYHRVESYKDKDQIKKLIQTKLAI